MNEKIPSAIIDITLNRATFTNMPINELTFVNFFYGNNGAGKSSVAHAIEENDGIAWADGRSAEDFDVLVYSQDYINRNFVNYGELRGVFIFGEEDIEAKKRIQQLTEEKTTTFTPLYSASVRVKRCLPKKKTIIRSRIPMRRSGMSSGTFRPQSRP